MLDTIITSATDTNTGTNIPSGTETTSNSITFTFEGSDHSANAGYTCSIENLEPFQCSSPVIYDTSILQEGGLNTNAGPQAHSFQVSAIDPSGDVDSTPSTFEWTTTGSAGLEAIPQEAIPQEAIPQEAIPQEAIPQETIPQEAIPQQNNSTRSNSTTNNSTRTTYRTTISATAASNYSPRTFNT